MRFINLYRFGYVAFVAGVSLALWRAGMLSNVAPIWMGIGLLVVVGLGIMFAVAAGRPLIPRHRD